MSQTRRRYCDNPKCGQQYRYTRDDSRTCSDACRTMLGRVNRAEAALAAADQARAVAAAWETIKQARAAQPTTAAVPPESVDRTPDAAPVEPKRKRKRPPLVFALPKEKTVTVVIRNIPKRFPGSSLRRGFR